MISIYRTLRIVFTEVRDFNLPKQSNFNLPDSANCIYWRLWFQLISMPQNFAVSIYQTLWFVNSFTCTKYCNFIKDSDSQIYNFNLPKIIISIYPRLSFSNWNPFSVVAGWASALVNWKSDCNVMVNWNSLLRGRGVGHRSTHADMSFNFPCPNWIR